MWSWSGSDSCISTVLDSVDVSSVGEGGSRRCSSALDGVGWLTARCSVGVICGLISALGSACSGRPRTAADGNGEGAEPGAFGKCNERTVS